MDESKRQELSVLFNSAFWITKEGLTFLKFSSLLLLQENNCVTVGGNYRNDIGYRMFVHAITADMASQLKDDLQKTRFRAYLSDGSTESDIKEQDIICVRFIKSGQSVTRFEGIEK